jgi:subtilisin family serine protease
MHRRHVFGLLVPLSCIGLSPRASEGASAEAAEVRATDSFVNVAHGAPFVRPPLESIVEGTILVRPRHGRPVEIAGARRTAVLADGTERWSLEGASSAEVTLEAREAIARSHPELDVELDLYRQAHAQPNDDGYARQWPLAQLAAPEAWAITRGDETLTVAVIDTGYVDHPDLLGRLVPGYDFISDPANAGDDDGRDPDPRDAGTEAEESSSFHGPHISGIIGAATDNAIGMAGVDWRCKILPVRALGVRRHRGRDSDIADAIRWAIGLNVPGVPRNERPARVINMSFGGPGFSRLLQDAVRAAVERGVLVVASAGNDATDARQNYPAALEGVVAVAAATPEGQLAPYSNHGPRVDFMAPGGSLFSESPSLDETPGGIWSTSWLRAADQPVFAYASGTSQAAAYATGVAALVRAAAPSLPPEVVASVMRRAAKMPDAGCPSGCGAGLLHAGRAVQIAKAIETASCGPAGCGLSNVLEPVPLRAEEGCAYGARPAQGTSAIAVVFAIVVAARRRRRTTSVGRTSGRIGWIISAAVGCLVAPSATRSVSARTGAVEPDPERPGGDPRGPDPAPPPPRRATDTPPLDTIVAGTLLLRAGGAAAADREAAMRALPNARRVLVLGDGSERWDFDLGTAEQTVEARAAVAAALPGQAIEHDVWLHAHAVKPTDELFEKQWALEMMRLPEAWTITKGDPNLVVAFVDTGYVDHPDLLPRLVPGYDFVSDPDRAGDGTGRDDDPRDAGDEVSTGFHGPHIAGIIGAVANNGGITGADWNCRLQPVRGLGLVKPGINTRGGRASDVADGIRWASGLTVPGAPQNATPARIINMSLGSRGYSGVLADAVKAAYGRGVLLVASAGNGEEVAGENRPFPAAENFPAAFEGVVAVAAAGPDRRLAEYSNYGARVDVMTPGGSFLLVDPKTADTPGTLLSTSWIRETNQAVYAYQAGTSQAAAYASGVAALVRAAAPSLPADVVAAVLRRASTVEEGACPTGCGSGLLDARRAVEIAREIETASCGPAGCGLSNTFEPAPLRPEEGCSVATPKPSERSWWVVAGLGLAAFARRRLAARRLRAAAAASVVVGAAWGCSAPPPTNELSSQSYAPPTVRLKNPVPTYVDGELTVTVGRGRSVEVEVTPAANVSKVEIALTDPPYVFGRLGHAPFVFELPAWVPGEVGSANVCVTALDADGRTGEFCFRARR